MSGGVSVALASSALGSYTSHVEAPPQTGPADPETPARAIPSRRRSWAGALLFLSAALYAFPYYPAINNPNENVRVQMTAAIVFDGTIEISGPRARWGWVNDAACVQWGQDGSASPCEGRLPRGAVRRYFSVKAPLTSLMGVPAMGLARLLGDDGAEMRTGTLWLLRVSASILPLFFFFFFFHGWLGRRVRSAVVRDLVFVATALGSVLLGYGYLYASHATSAAAAFAGFAVLFDMHTGARPATLLRALLAGFFVTAATALEYPCFVVTFVLCLYALRALPWRRVPLFALGALVPTLIVMAFQWAAYGNPLTPGHLFVENSAFRAGHESGFFGADAFHADAAWRLLFDLRLGLFPLTPLFLLAIPGAVLAMRRRRAAALAALGACGGLYLVICLMNNWDGGWSLGPRYLVVIVPFVALAAAIGLDELVARRPRAGLVVGVALTGASLAIGGTLSVLYPHLPPEIDWPLAHVVPAIVRADLATPNLLTYLGAEGTKTLLPLVVLGGVALAWATHRTRDLLVLAPAFALGVWTVAASVLLAPAPTPAVQQALQFITQHW